MTQDFERQRGSSLLLKLIFVTAIIITANCAIGIIAPVFYDVEDEIGYLDTLWRVVLGQRVGIDYHNPQGFGPYQLGAVLWHWLGPHYYVMRLAITLFSLSISLCGCIVAKRVFARRMDLGSLFCVTLAFQLSEPTIFGNHLLLGMSGFYDRQIVCALAVLFLLTFSGDSTLSRREHVLEIALAAFLLNVLFLLKISGLVVGLMILLAGCLLPGRAVRRLLNLCAALLLFAAITAIEFKITGLELLPVIQDYQLAAHARLTHSFMDLVRGVVFSGPLVGSIALLVLFAVSRRPGELQLDFRCIGLIIGTYAASQYAMNITNNWDPNMWLAPAAVTSLANCIGVKPAAQQAGGSESWWRRFARSGLAEISAREAIPLLIFVLVLVPVMMPSIIGTTVGALVSLGIKTPYVVTAGKGVSFRTWLHAYRHGPQVNNAVAAIASLNLGHEAIANIDFANPFPVLFLAPPPKGIQVWWDFGFNLPRNVKLEWQDVIGDACVVTIPAQPDVPQSAGQLAQVVRSKLTTDFEIVYQGEYWTIYRRARDCASAPLLRDQRLRR
jgi:hypothetical protein